MSTRDDPKARSLRSDNAFNDQAGAITDPVFRSHPFFDPRDRVQARYEMLRRHHFDGLTVTAAAAAFGVSRPTFYQAQTAFEAGGLPGLVPHASGPEGWIQAVGQDRRVRARSQGRRSHVDDHQPACAPSSRILA